MTFTPNYRSVGLDHRPFGLSYVSDVLYCREVGEPPQQHNQFAAAEDYAVLRLYDPRGDQLGYFGSTDYNDDWDNLPVWSNVGYTDGDGPFAQTDQTIVDGGQDKPTPRHHRRRRRERRGSDEKFLAGGGEMVALLEAARSL